MIIYNKDEKTGELYHYGIKGQKWGVRRYQNEDGTYTKEGLNRRLKDAGVTANLRNRSRTKKLAKMQEKVGKQFDKHTEKILQDRKMGVRVSDRRIKKAVNLGTQFRKYDYMAKDPKYLNIMEKHDTISELTTLPVAGALVALGLNGVVLGAAPVAAIGAVKGGIEGAVVSKKIDKYYNDVFEKSKDLTIEDLKKHGVIQ